MPLISIAEAFTLILEKTPRAPISHVPLNEALGHYLAEDIRADRDYPPFNRSMVDGYAVFSIDTRAAPDVLELIEEVPAGKTPTKAISPGETIKIMTGAPVPAGADAVVMREQTDLPRPGFVRFTHSAKSGQNIARQASDSRAGDIVINSGTRITPAEIGVLATVGCVSVPVRKLPTCAILGTGDEIIEPHVKPGPAQIRNSNSHQLLAQCAAANIPAQYLGIAPDDRATTRDLIAQGIQSELFISTGGVSVGDHDHVGASFKELLVEIHFDKVAIKPGKPTTFGTCCTAGVPPASIQCGAGVPPAIVFGLPGNPVAAWVCFHLFVMTAIRVRCGATDPLPKWYTLPLIEPSGGSGDRTTFRPCKLVIDQGATKVRPIEWHGSGHLSALVGADGLFVHNVGADLQPGQNVTFYPF